MLFIVQAIEVNWAKGSRGFPGAAKRNAIPEAFPISRCELGAEGGILSQHFYTHGFEDFDVNCRAGIRWQKARDGRIRFHCCYLKLTLESVAVRYQDSMFGGAPIRYPYGADAFVVTPGTWGRLRYNGRFAGEDGWWYEKIVLNVAATSEMSDDLFLGTPDFLWSGMADLR